LKLRAVLYPASAFFFLAVSLSLSSCLGVAADTTILSDGSGTLSLVYTVPRELQAVGAMDPTAKYLPFPTDRADFETAVSSVGITLSSYDEKTTESDLVITVSCAFPSLESLSTFLSGGGRSLEIQRSDAGTAIHLVLSNGQPLAEAKARDAAASLLGGYSVAVTLHLPSPAKSAGIGSLDATRRTVSYSIPTLDLVNAVQPVELMVRY
jgi:hypothetical protein